MTDKELKALTSDFQDISSLLIEKNRLINKIAAIRRKLKTKENYYRFLQNILIKNGTILEKDLVKYFKSIGFSNIERGDQKGSGKREDITIRNGNQLLIIEVTGIDKPNPEEAKAHQISKHIPTRQKENPDLHVHGCFIVNHDTSKPIKSRNPKPFNKILIETAKNANYSLISTIDLLYAYLAFKRGEVTAEEIFTWLCTPGKEKTPGTTRKSDK